MHSRQSWWVTFVSFHAHYERSNPFVFLSCVQNCTVSNINKDNKNCPIIFFNQGPGSGTENRHQDMPLSGRLLDGRDQPTLVFHQSACRPTWNSFRFQSCYKEGLTTTAWHKQRFNINIGRGGGKLCQRETRWTIVLDTTLIKKNKHLLLTSEAEIFRGFITKIWVQIWEPGLAWPMPTLLRALYLRDCGFDFHTVFAEV